MKTILITTTLSLMLLASAANADQITAAQVQNLQNMAQVANDKADIADAQGNHVSAAQWREQAHNFERQAEQLRSQSRNVDNAINAIAGAINN